MLVCNILILVLLWASASSKALPTSEPRHLLVKRLAVGTEASYANMAVSAIEKVIMKEKPLNEKVCLEWIKIRETPRFQWRCKKFG